MAIKITGAVLIIITSCIIGYLLSIKEDLRCMDLSEIEKILQNIFSHPPTALFVLTLNLCLPYNAHSDNKFHLH